MVMNKLIRFRYILITAVLLMGKIHAMNQSSKDEPCHKPNQPSISVVSIATTVNGSQSPIVPSATSDSSSIDSKEALDFKESKEEKRENSSLDDDLQTLFDRNVIIAASQYTELIKLGEEYEDQGNAEKADELFKLADSKVSPKVFLYVGHYYKTLVSIELKAEDSHGLYIKYAEKAANYLTEAAKMIDPDVRFYSNTGLNEMEKEVCHLIIQCRTQV